RKAIIKVLISSEFFHVNRIPSHKRVAAVTFIAEQGRRCSPESKDRILHNRATVADRIKEISKVIVMRALVAILHLVHQFFRVEHALSAFRSDHYTGYRGGSFRADIARPS